jgi:subtilisin family serine protease
MGESPKKLKVYPLRFTDGADSPELLFTHQYRYLKALEMAVGLDVDIINVSYTHGMPNEKEEALIKKALEKNILIIVAAGNKGIDFDKKKDSLTYPCNYELANVVCVGNYDKEKKARDENSNFGSAVKVWTDGNLKVGFSNDLTEGLTIMSGSSSSAALITRELARLKTREERQKKIMEWIKTKEPVVVKYP